MPSQVGRESIRLQWQRLLVNVRRMSALRLDERMYNKHRVIITPSGGGLLDGLFNSTPYTSRLSSNKSMTQIQHTRPTQSVQARATVPDRLTHPSNLDWVKFPIRLD